MPQLTNITEVATNPQLISACATALVEMSYRVQVSETPILYPNAGYKAYQKRTELAAKVIANPLEYGKRAAVLAEIAYANIVWDVEVNQNQFDAMTSLAYNIGVGAFSNSTLLKKVNAKDFTGAGNEFLKWDKSNGKPLLGLTRRRQREKELFLRA